MELIVLGSSSRGSCYLLKNAEECLMLECGIAFKKVKEAVNYKLSNIVGCLLSHEHMDDCRNFNEVMNYGINVYMSPLTKEALGVEHHRIKTVQEFNSFQLGGFTILPFKLCHNSAEPFGYVIHHKDSGSILFIPETYYMEYRFENISQIMVECNYSTTKLRENVEQGLISVELQKNIIRAHFELDNVVCYLKASLTPKLRKVILLNLSRRNSDPQQFKAAVETVFSKVYIAEKGLVIELSED